MPEGHVIHRIAKLHNRLIAGQALAVSSPQGRFAKDAAKVDGRTLTQVVPHGKHLFYHFDNDLAVHIHLGMHGMFRTLLQEDDGTLPPVRGLVRMRLEGRRKAIELTGPTTCETLTAKQVQAVHDRLGPDLLDAHPDVEKVWERVHASKAPIGVLLMDQAVMSGIGNAYRAEILYRARMHPMIPGNRLSREQFDEVWKDSVRLMQIGKRHKDILTVDEVDIGKKFRHHGPEDRFAVYRREACRHCGAKTKVLMMAGRECYFCTKEQVKNEVRGVKVKAPRAAKPKPKTVAKRKPAEAA